MPERIPALYSRRRFATFDGRNAGFLAQEGLIMEQTIQTVPPERTSLWWTQLAARWSARLSATLLMGLVLLIFIGEGVLGGGGPNLAKMDWPSRFMTIAFFVSTAGLAVVWWRELLGSAFILGGMVVFYWLNNHASGKFPGGAFPLFYVPGILAAISWVLHRPSAKS
jgi:hypothetical protein